MTSEIEALQAKVAWAEDLLETLNTTVWRQHQRIERLEGEVRELRRLVQDSLPQAEANARDEIPPHW